MLLTTRWQVPRPGRATEPGKPPMTRCVALSVEAEPTIHEVGAAPPRLTVRAWARLDGQIEERA